MSRLFACLLAVLFTYEAEAAPLYRWSGEAQMGGRFLLKGEQETILGEMYFRFRSMVEMEYDLRKLIVRYWSIPYTFEILGQLEGAPLFVNNVEGQAASPTDRQYQVDLETGAIDYPGIPLLGTTTIDGRLTGQYRSASVIVGDNILLLNSLEAAFPNGRGVFDIGGGSTLNGYRFERVDTTPVPEPGSALLLAMLAAPSLVRRHASRYR